MANVVVVSSSDGLMNTIVEVERELEVECRVCLANSDSGRSFFNLSGLVDTGRGAEHTQSLQDILAQICLVAIESDDGLPDGICGECKDCLLAAFKLQLRAQRSDAELRRRLNLLPVTGETDFKDPVLVAEYDAEGLLLEEVEVDPEDPDAGQVTGDTAKDEFDTFAPRRRRYPACDVCGKEFRKSHYLQRHKAVHQIDPDRPFQCNTCYKRFHLNSTLKLHSMVHSKGAVQTATTTQTWECDSMDDVAFEEHWQVHELKPTMTGEPLQEFKCLPCDTLFKKATLFDRHMRTVHAEQRPLHKCNICDQSFAGRSLLTDHMNTHVVGQHNQCETCGKAYRTKRCLQQHMRTHSESGSASSLCTVCGKGFATQSSLTQHLARHSGEKPFACDECPGRFGTKASLVTHQRIHTGAKPYGCKECDAAFSTHFSLSKHKRVHSGERPYVCEVCGMRFNSSYHVRRHIRTHTGDKPYACPYCDRCFAQSNDLVKHKRSHIGKNTYQCNECPSMFRLHGELKAHLAQHFRENKKRQEMEEGLSEVVVTTT